MAFLFFLPFCNAQVKEKETQNLVTNPVFTGTNGWSVSGFTAGNPSGAFTFSYTAGFVTQIIPLANVFNELNLPIQVTGLRYGWSYSIWCNNSIGGYCENPKGPVDSLTAGVTLYGKNDAEIYKKSHTYNTYNPDWQYENVTVKFNKSYDTTELNRLVFTFAGKDEGYWAGFYGPRITAVHARMIYQPNVCSVDPSLDVTCPGYTQAIFSKQCITNPLSSPQCPGYTEAFLSQQCSANPLYNSSCPGYQQAYFAQQCTQNPMYNATCPGYEQARLQQVCAMNPLNDNRCPGYQQANLEKQCKENPLYNTTCPGYSEAFLALQCTANQLFSPSCPQYAYTFLRQQCASNVFYSPECPGYETARKQRAEENLCASNPQANPKCPGYIPPRPVVVQIPSIGNEDPVRLLTTPQLTNDPFVNQVLNREPSTDNSRSLEQTLQQRPTRQTQVATQRRKEEEQRQQSTRTQVTPQRQQTQQQRQQLSPQEQTMADLSKPDPAFVAYEVGKIPDVPFYKPEDIYKRVTIQDNMRAQRQLNQRSDRIHKEMVDEQYNR